MWFIRRRLAIAASLVAMLGLAGPTLGGIAVCCEGRHLADTGELPPCCEGEGHVCPMHATSPVADGPRVELPRIAAILQSAHTPLSPPPRG